MTIVYLRVGSVAKYSHMSGCIGRWLFNYNIQMEEHQRKMGNILKQNEIIKAEHKYNNIYFLRIS